MKTLKNILICMAAIVAVSCNESGKKMEPEAVVEAFNRAVASGDFKTAESLCDTVSMKTHIEKYKEAANIMQKEDSSTFVIASSILAGAEFEVNGTWKNGDERIITYTIRTGDETKAKKAVLKKKKGEWKLTEIISAI